MAESAILQPTILRLGQRPDVRLWRQNTGVGRSMDGQRVIKFGIVGGGDASGIVRGGGRLEVETKTATGKQSPAQRNFQTMIESMGGIYIKPRSEDEAEQLLEAELAKRCPHCGGAR